MKADYFQNNKNINDSNKPTNANSEIKPSLKNIDNNKNYSDSDEVNSQSSEKKNNKHSFQEESELKKENLKESNDSQINNFKKNKNNEIQSNNNNLLNNQLNNKMINQQRPTYTGYISDQKVSGYSNFFINNYKRPLSGEKNDRTNFTFYSPNPNKNNAFNRFANSNSKYNNFSNNNINKINNYTPINPNTTLSSIKRTPQDEININNFRKNLNQDFYKIRNNNDNGINNYNVNPVLNQTSPNIIPGKYITNVKKLPKKTIEDDSNLNKIQSDDIQYLPNRNQLNRENELPGGNNTIGFLPLRKPFSNTNLPNYQNLINNNKNNDMSLTMNYGLLNKYNQINQNNNQPLNFEQALKINQLNNANNNNGRVTIVKKLPPMNDSDSDPKDNINQNRIRNNQTNTQALGANVARNNLLENNNIPMQNDRNASNMIQNLNNQNNNMLQNPAYNARINPSQNQQLLNNQQNNQNQILDAAIVNRNYLPQNEASNSLLIKNRQQQANQINNNPNQLPEVKKLQNYDTVSENSEDINITNKKTEKKNVDISYNDFDGSGWVKNYGGVSRPGKDVMGNQKINQDAIVSMTNINDMKDFNIFGVLDGHGPQGHYVSEFASEFIPSEIINNEEIKALNDPEQIYEKLKENNCEIITNAFLYCDEELKKVNFDTLSSGSTCVLIIHIGTHIICANVGDSRGIIAYLDEDANEDPELNELEAAQLSIDYKPDLPQEKERILSSGGVVEKMKNEFGEGVGPFRVWAKGKDYPGLAMSRSIGDFKGKEVGVIAVPGIMEYDLCEASKYIVICSDGVWEFLNNEIVKDLGKSFYLNDDPSGFCHHIVNNSVVQWEKKEIIIDDITIVVVFF